MNPLNHVAIIMDGNGRWGLKYKGSRNEGHKAGLITVEKIIKESIKQRINFLTLYAFSTENWNRPIKEVNYLFNLLENFLFSGLEDNARSKSANCTAHTCAKCCRTEVSFHNEESTVAKTNRSGMRNCNIWGSLAY